MKPVVKLIGTLVLCLTMSELFSQADIAGLFGHQRLPGRYVGWSPAVPGSVAGSLEIRNDFAGWPIEFYTNGFMRMTILDGGAGPAAGFVGINCTSVGVNAPNQLFTVRGGNINLISPAGNTAWMLSSARFLFCPCHFA